MEQLRSYGDERQLAQCVYCAGYTETRDHVPSRILLDEPYPANLPVVPACQTCNESFSLDEEYVACLVECVHGGTANADEVQRHKIRRILSRKPAMTSKFAEARNETKDGVAFRIEADRVRNVVLKLGRGHAAFELNEPQFDEPTSLSFVPFPSLTRDERERFERPPAASIWPEVGSRAMQRLVSDSPGEATWVTVQPGRYRYLTSAAEGVLVRVVISEYLGCEVLWNR